MTLGFEETTRTITERFAYLYCDNPLCGSKEPVGLACNFENIAPVPEPEIPPNWLKQSKSTVTKLSSCTPNRYYYGLRPSYWYFCSAACAYQVSSPTAPEPVPVP
jgi:hypothetical protein